MSDERKFDVRRDEGLVTIAGRGELNLYVAPELSRLLEEALASGEDIIVDLTQAIYIDSAILMALIAVNREMSRVGRKVKVLVSNNGHPHYALKVSGMDSLLDVVVSGG